MNEPIKKIAVLTSGGDAPGMNAAIRAVVRACTYYRIECIGIYRGYEGLIEGDFETLTGRHVSNIINKGGTILKSARSKEFMTEEGREKAHENLKKAGIPVAFELYEGCYHGFDAVVPEAAISKAAWHFLLTAYSDFVHKYF